MKILGSKQDSGAARCKCREGLAQHNDSLGVESSRGLIDEEKRRREREGTDGARLPSKAPPTNKPKPREKVRGRPARFAGPKGKR